LTLTQQECGTVTASWSDLNTDAVTSVFGRTGAVVATEGDYSLTQLSDVTITSPSNGQVLKYNGTTWVNDTDSNTGTVTSVGLSAPTGFSVTNSPVTSSGTLTLSFASGYSLPTTASQTNWDTAYTNRITSLTTTGSSGAATLVSNTLNIPNYTLAGLGGVSGSGTTNYIPKFTSSSAIGNSVIYDNGGNIGINTTNPSYKFQVEGGAGYFNLNGSGTTVPLYVNNSSTAAGVQVAKIGFASSGAIKSSIAAAVYGNDYMTFNVGSDAERMRLDASGNLGLGTSSPAYKLDVSGIIGSSGTGLNSSIRINNTTATTGRDWHLYSLNNGNFGLFNNTSSAYAYIVDASGNLGLGVTPSAWSLGNAIDISGGVGILGYNNATQITNNAYYNGGWKYKATSAASNFVLNNDGSYQFNIAPSGTAGNAITFTQAMTLFSTGNLAVGGTSDNGYKLDVNGTGRFGGTSTYNGFLIGSHSNNVGAAIYNKGLANATLYADNASTVLNAETNLYLRTANTDRLTIASTGAATFSSSVGVGASPASLLYAYSSTSTAEFRLERGGVGDVGARWKRNGSDLGYISNADWIIAGASSTDFGVTAVNNLIFGTASTERMRITSGGNVGIGTSSPTQALDVLGIINIGRNQNAFVTNFNINSGSTPISAFQINTDQPNLIAALVSRNSYALTFGTSDTERMRITSAGELLINTTSDAGDYKLQVNGNVYINGKSHYPNTGNVLSLETYLSNQDKAITNFYQAQNYPSSNSYTRVFDIVSSGDATGGGVIRFLTSAGNTAPTASLILTTSQNAEFGGSIKTAAPSGGTAKPWKLGEAGVTLGGSNTSGVRVEIDGTVYYLVTGYLP